MIQDKGHDQKQRVVAYALMNITLSFAKSVVTSFNIAAIWVAGCPFGARLCDDEVRANRINSSTMVSII
ncbi:MAG: hypothetical protein U0930_14455 [Pirellulales bacterium]